MNKNIKASTNTYSNISIIKYYYQQIEIYRNIHNLPSSSQSLPIAFLCPLSSLVEKVPETFSIQFVFRAIFMTSIC